MARYACIEKRARVFPQSPKITGNRMSLNCRKACVQQYRDGPNPRDSAAIPAGCWNIPAEIAGVQKPPEGKLRWRPFPFHSQGTFQKCGAAVNRFAGWFSIENAIAADNRIELHRNTGNRFG